MVLQQKIMIGIVLVMSAAAFAAFGMDKRRAIRKQWRIPEATLLLLAFCGGAPGALAGMRVFHHKTQKWKFRIAVPLFLALQLLLIIRLRG